MKINENGLILWEGKSHYNGEEIVVIATGLKSKSSNTKTGDLIQTWILLKNASPIEASKSCDDSAVCGKCPLRRSLGGACYVTLHQAPTAVYNAYKRGSYRHATKADLEKMKSRMVRIGAYGDPCAVPVRIWRSIVGKWFTGYTHGWKQKNALKALAMASVDNITEMHEAQSKGFRTFRVLKPGEDKTASEILCPAVSKGMSCADCKLCKGASIGSRSIAIPAHGGLVSRMKEKEFEVERELAREKVLSVATDEKVKNFYKGKPARQNQKG